LQPHGDVAGVEGVAGANRIYRAVAANVDDDPFAVGGQRAHIFRVADHDLARTTRRAAPRDALRGTRAHQLGEFVSAAEQNVAALDERRNELRAPARSPQPVSQIWIDDPEPASCREESK